MLFNPYCVLNQLVKVRVINHQSVRWRRVKKPFWLGVAKTKIFIVPEKKIVRTPEEEAEVNRLNEEYKIQMTSLLDFIKNNPLSAAELKAGEETQTLEVDKEIEASLKVNKEWNAQSAKLREERLKIFEEQEMNRTLQMLEIFQQRENKKRERIEEIVRLEKINSKTFITPENIDETIENCLGQVVEYNYAIDLKGKKYEGKELFSEILKKLETKKENVKVDETN